MDFSPVFISLHGGGAQSPAKNDRQWQAHQQRYPLADGLYLCPRAPRDLWDQWHAERVIPFIDALIKELLVHEEIDPDRIYLMGYSAGGYGALQLGGQLTDRFAAVAAAPTPGATPVEHWRHLPLRLEIGERDNAYGRIKLCRAYEGALRFLRQHSPDHYRYCYIDHEDRGHQIDDRSSVEWLAQHRRQLRPKELVWTPSSSLASQYYWLANETPGKGQRVEARIEGNEIHLGVHAVQHLQLRLDDQLVDLDQPVTVFANGIKIFHDIVERRLRCLVKTLEERGDPQLMFTSELSVYIP